MKKKNTETIKVPISMKKNLETGKTEYQYKEIPLDTYVKWLEHCYECRGTAI